MGVALLLGEGMGQMHGFIRHIKWSQIVGTRAVLVLSLGVSLGGTLARADSPASSRAGSQAGSVDEVTNFQPTWIRNYQVWNVKADLNIANDSYLLNRNVGELVTDPLANQIGTLMDHGHVLQWNQQYADMNRDYDQKERAGLLNPTVEQAHEGAMAGFSNGVLDDIEKRKLQTEQDKVVQVAEKNETVQTVVKTVTIPGAVVAGVYMGVWIGKPINWHMSDDMQFSFRTSVRDKLGQIELHSPLLYGSFEFHQTADTYALISPTNVDFGQMMDLNHIVDFQSEKCQFKVARTLPFVNLDSSVIYGSSSNVVASSLTKHITTHLAAVVDSLYYLTPYDPDHSLEERVRLRYDVHF